MQLPWLYKEKMTSLGFYDQMGYNKPRYGRVYNFKYYLIIGFNNNWAMMNFLDDGTNNVDYEWNNRTIIFGNVMNMSLIFTVGNYGDIYSDEYLCHGYYVIRFSLSPFNLQ